jgi:regulatory protein
LQELALAYVARFSTSASKLETYLKRKLREKGWDGDEEPDVKAISARYVELGYIDDAAYARAKAVGLLNRGYGARRVSDALYAAGIDEHIREDVAPNELKKREAVQTLARKRKFGPYYIRKEDEEELDPKRREKQIAAMLRAGHGFDMVRTVMNARDEEAVEQWVAEAAPDGEYDVEF